MRGSLRLLVVFALALVVAAPAFASDEEARLKQLEDRVSELETENASLKSGQDALSQEIEDYLEDSSAYEAAQGAGANAGYDNGFYIRGSNGFVINFHFGLQFRVKGFDKDDDAANPRAQTGFEVARARFWMDGHAWSDISYMFEIDEGNESNQGGRRVLDIWIQWEVNSQWSIRGGQQKPTLFRQERNMWYSLQFVDRAVISEFFNRDRAIGVSADYHKSDQLHIQFGVFNTLGFFGPPTGNSAANLPFDVLAGNPLQVGDADNQFAYTFYLEYAVKGTWKDAWGEGDRTAHADQVLVFGVSFGYENNNNPAFAGTDQFLFGVDGVYKHRGLSIQGEWFSYMIDGGGGIADTAFHGFSIQAGYFVRAQVLEIVVRGGWMQADDAGLFVDAFELGTALAIASSDDTTEIALGANWYPNQAAGERLKVSIDVTYVEYVRAGSATTNINVGDRGWIIRAQVQFLF